MRIRQSIKNKIACMMSILCACTLCSCKKEPVVVPELMEPVSGTESYREVTYGDVGAMKIEYGSIVPTEHALFWTTQVEVDSILVDIGDYVEKGQVVATADLDAAREKKESLERDSAVLTKKHELEVKKHELMLQKLNLQIEGQRAIHDTAGEQATQKEIETEQENANYDELLYQHQLSDYAEQIADQNEIIEDGTLTADMSGYVSYVRELTNSNTVTSAQNVVVVSDYENTYIKLSGVTIKDRNKLLDKYDNYYTIQDGKKIKLREYAYSEQERFAAENQSKYPALRFQFADSKAHCEVGMVIPVYLTKDRVEQVLYVGNDSLYEDEQGSFVYVKEGEQRQQRYIETGVSDSINTEVLSGLREGDKVYYAADTAWPDAYEPYEVATATDYDATFVTNRYAVADTTRKNYTSPFEGKIVSVNVSNNQEVEKGDVLMTVQTDEGSAQLAEMRSGIEDIKKAYEDTTTAHQDMIQKLENEKKGAMELPVAKADEVQPDAVATASDATGTAEQSETDDATGTAEQSETDDETKTPELPENPNQASMIDCDIQMENVEFQIQTVEYEYQLINAQEAYNKASANNNGSGVMSIVAKAPGRVLNLWLYEGYKLKTGDPILSIDTPAKSKLTVYGNNQGVALGTKVQIQDDASGKIIHGSICGSSGDRETEEGNCYITVVDGKAYVTQSVTEDTTRYYIELEDSSILESSGGKYTISYPLVSFSDIYTIPASVLYTEPAKTEKGTDRYYIWKIVDGNLEKQYVTASVYGMTQNTSSYKQGDVTACIFDGVTAGDVLAAPISEAQE